MPPSALRCPKCGSDSLDPHVFESMIVVTQSHALFSMSCPSCGARVSSLRAIPTDMCDEVVFAAIEVGAGMGRE